MRARDGVDGGGGVILLLLLLYKASTSDLGQPAAA